VEGLFVAGVIGLGIWLMRVGGNSNDT
jgi:hypothetical protein